MLLNEWSIHGFHDGSEAEKTMYLIFIAFGVITLFIVYPAQFYNEGQYLNLVKIYDKLEKSLYIAKDNRTTKYNTNKLVFAEGKLSFALNAKDELFGFESTNAIQLYRHVEIY